MFACMHIIVAACIADIAFVIDNSGSIRDNQLPGENNFQLIIDFVKSIIDVLTVTHDGIKIALVDFGMDISFCLIFHIVTRKNVL